MDKRINRATPSSETESKSASKAVKIEDSMKQTPIVRSDKPDSNLPATKQRNKVLIQPVERIE